MSDYRVLSPRKHITFLFDFSSLFPFVNEAIFMTSCVTKCVQLKPVGLAPIRPEIN